MADIVWKTTRLPDAIVGVPYQGSLATYGGATALTAVSATGLPASGNLVCSLTNGVLILGTPAKADVGTYTVVVTLTDTAGASASGSLTLVVRYKDEGDNPALNSQGVLVQADEARKWPK